mmetsp:Transcript_20936/g.54575  ORF Transcript_20936/g.54575 Transcript_20936/m.54575 type:complete len:221 (+) Transcript_20936:108-770(+)
MAVGTAASAAAAAVGTVVAVTWLAAWRQAAHGARCAMQVRRKDMLPRVLQQQLLLLLLLLLLVAQPLLVQGTLYSLRLGPGQRTMKIIIIIISSSSSSRRAPTHPLQLGCLPCASYRFTLRIGSGSSNQACIQPRLPAAAAYALRARARRGMPVEMQDKVGLRRESRRKRRRGRWQTKGTHARGTASLSCPTVQLRRDLKGAMEYMEGQAAVQGMVSTAG